MSEYFEGPHPGPGYGETGIQQMDVRCFMCRKYLCKILTKSPIGIQGVYEFIVKNKVGHMCEDCYKKSGLVLGPLDNVKLK